MLALITCSTLNESFYFGSNFPHPSAFSIAFSFLGTISPTLKTYVLHSSIMVLSSLVSKILLLYCHIESNFFTKSKFALNSLSFMFALTKKYNTL